MLCGLHGRVSWLESDNTGAYEVTSGTGVPSVVISSLMCVSSSHAFQALSGICGT